MKFTNLKKTLSAILAAAMVCSIVPFVSANGDNELILHYTFDEPAAETEDGTLVVKSEIDNGLDGAVTGNVEIENGYAYFDGAESYITIPAVDLQGNDNATFVINVRPEMQAANQFTFTFGKEAYGGYFFLNTHRPAPEVCRAAITTTDYNAEKEVAGDFIPRGEWASIAVVFEGTVMKMYINGELAGVNENSAAITDIELTQNYIARSQFWWADPCFKGYVDDFRVYAEALSEEDIVTIANAHAENSETENTFIAKRDLEDAADMITFPEKVLTEDISLPSETLYAHIEWESDKPDVLSAEGVVTRQENDTVVTLTARVYDDLGNETFREFKFTVLHAYTDEEMVNIDFEALHLVGNLEHLKENLYLPTKGAAGSDIVWTSSDESVVTSEGVITQKPSGEGGAGATLTAKVTSGDAEKSKTYDIVVEEEDYAYLFAYFTGNNANQEKMFYGISRDGYNYNTLNGGNPVLEETVGTGCLRDPFIFRGQDGLYYCLVTDMRSSLGWSGDTAITTWSSTDLINWENETLIDFKEIEGFEAIDRAWAPQAIWDPEFYDEETGEYGAYMIYLALRFGTGQLTQMYKVYTHDMQNLITKPEKFYSHSEYGQDIDSDIIYKDGLYYMYVKDEDDNGKLIYVVTSEHAGGPYGERINVLPSDAGGGVNVGVEGSAIYKKIGEDKYLLIYDAYNAGFFVMSETEDLVNFNQLPRNAYGFDFTPRHGYVVTVSKDECDALMAKYGKVIPDDKEPSEGPIIYYDFNEDSLDKSGSGYNANLHESAAIGEGISGTGGLYLDGTAESYAEVPSSAVSGLTDYTVSAWIKPEADAITQRVFDFGTGQSRYMFLTPYYAKGVVRYAVTIESYGYENGISVDASIPTNEWTHLAVTSFGKNIALYINGEKKGEIEGVELDPYEISPSMQNCYIGKSQYPNDAMYKGAIDEFKVYDRALSEEEVKALYLKDTPLYYDVAEKDETVTVSLTGNGIDLEAAEVAIAQYNEEGIMTGVTFERVTFSPDSKTAEVTMDVTEKEYKALVFTSFLKPARK